MKRMLIVWILFLFSTSVVIHDVGHYIPAKIFGCDPKFELLNYVSTITTNNCNNVKELAIGLYGIFTGFIYLLLVIRYLSPDKYIQKEKINIINISIIFGYIGSSIPDMIRIIKIFSQL